VVPAEYAAFGDCARGFAGGADDLSPTVSKVYPGSDDRLVYAPDGRWRRNDSHGSGRHDELVSDLR